MMKYFLTKKQTCEVKFKLDLVIHKRARDERKTKEEGRFRMEGGGGKRVGQWDVT